MQNVEIRNAFVRKADNLGINNQRFPKAGRFLDDPRIAFRPVGPVPGGESYPTIASGGRKGWQQSRDCTEGASRSGRSVMKGWRHFIQRLNPYIALALLAVPIAIVEPLKLIGLFIFGKGHWITGSLVMLFAYAGSLLAVERLFKIVRPNLMTLHWFAAAWKWLRSGDTKRANGGNCDMKDPATAADLHCD